MATAKWKAERLEAGYRNLTLFLPPEGVNALESMKEKSPGVSTSDLVAKALIVLVQAPQPGGVESQKDQIAQLEERVTALEMMPPRKARKTRPVKCRIRLGGGPHPRHDRELLVERIAQGIARDGDGFNLSALRRQLIAEGIRAYATPSNFWNFAQSAAELIEARVKQLQADLNEPRRGGA